MDKIRAVIAAVVTVATSAALLGAAPPAGPRTGPALPGTPAAGRAASAVQAPWPHGAVRTVGKLIGTYPGGRLLTCSGAVVDAPNGSVVVTAAHCVHNPGEPRWERAWFVPGYHRHGTGSVVRSGWQVTSVQLAPDWRRGRLPEALPYDYAFLTVEKKDGRTLQEHVGANRLDFAPVDPGERTVALGYPATGPYDGETLGHCTGFPTLLTTRDTRPPNTGGLLMESCDLTRGSSGGPWLRDYDPRSQSGTVVAVVSVGDDRGRVLGRPFPAEARRLLAAAGRVPAPSR
ncbi:serine protease [Streptomyces sp. TRM 70361]|uniref:trypsin-like serine peptidase n=1 Tax=Streptomyces sp. TRM 70361 TaxID=3116553 RepID=UPI002E7B02D4|nr:serine protease [Streptomyces sp. TRM 70361]MEE1941759.1 serine protease [Streptomyces sp. TRM 70361]